MRFVRLTIMLALLAVVMTACTPVRLEQARKGLKRTVATLPESEQFTIIATVSGGDYRRYGDTMCCYAHAYVAIGSHLSEKEALAIYLKELEACGWTLVRGISDSSQEYELLRGEQEAIWVSLGAPSWMVKSDRDYQREYSRYRSLVNLSVFYDLPSWAACMGE